MKLLMTMRTVLCLANLAFHPARGALLPPTTKVELVSLLSRGGYGEVHFARAPGAAELVAKVARPLDPAEAERAAAYLDAEATANAGVLGCPGICQYLGEASTSEGERCLLFERIRPLGGGEGPATTCADLLRPGLAPPPIAPREVLRQLLVALSHIHRAGYLHRDIKLENVLLGAAAAGPSVKLIDLGSAVSLEGCGLFERMWGGCELDALSTPCSPVYSPPERFADTEHPFALDVFAAAVCFLRLAWPAALRTEEATEEWRAELAAAGGDLERWLRTRVRATAVPEAWLDSLAAFPAADAAAFAVLRSMLHPDPAFRPSVDAVLAHPFLSPPGCAPAAVTPAPRRTDTDARLLERLLSVECRLPGYAVSERPLSVRVALRRPLGLVLGEVGRADGGGVTIDEILPGGHAAGSALRVGDRLVIVGERSLRGATYEESIAALAAGGRELELLFERSCAGVEGCELPEEIGSPGASAAPAGAAASAGATSPRGAALVVSDSGVFASRGGRTHMEDTSVLTSFSARTPAGLRSFVLAAVFDGHRGGDASAHLRSSLSRATSDALAAGEPSPLAVGWRRVVESYLGTGRQDGSTASAVLVEVLNCGDSRCVISSGSAGVLHATADHAAGAPEEVARIRASGGSVDCAAGGAFRVAVDAPSAGVGAVFKVAVARALGGSEWVGGRISNAAEVATLRLPPDAAAVIVATDGLWGSLDETHGSAAAARIVCAARQAALSAGEAAQQLVAHARAMGSDDNCVVIVLYLSGPLTPLR